ncbi:MEDS domain-containing protein [Bacillus sp. YZJH907-2]|uniref:histidine kinase n=2 Tax=Halalkalibacter suaedae TaxID=2822140 RepID=A0A941AT55_9BACI|nr:ATP-binding protein [Bacillus suaedae]MBP3950924.1 MEDS domain-containing protein [Bacillus suaedae]
MKRIHPIISMLNDAAVVKSTGHILYMFNELDKYIENAVDYIYQGLIKGEKVLFVEEKDVINQIVNRLDEFELEDDYKTNFIYMSSHEFYLNEGELDVERAGNELTGLMRPLLDQGHAVRTWGAVPLPNHESTFDRVRTYECDCDVFISKERMTSVCAYNALTIPAFLQNELFKTHTHFMTDESFSISPLFDNGDHKPLSVHEVQRLQRLEKKFNNLKDVNHRLEYENNLVKLKKEAIEQSEQKLRMIINELPIPIIIRNKTGVIFSNNEAKEQFLLTNHHKEVLQFFENYDHQHSEGNLSEQPLLIDSIHYYVVYSIDLMYEDEQAVMHSFVDLSQEKENEKLLIRSEKMAIVGELAASIAHELRNPLTSVKGFFQMMKTTNEKMDLYYTIIDDELSRIEQIASELLSLAKPHIDNWKEHNAVRLIEEVKLLLTSQTNMNNIRILLETDSAELNITCDSHKIKQVFINLIKNAIDSMGNGGTIFLKIKELCSDIEIQVIDQGTGMPRELLERIGEAFYTTKEKGTGIGLMVCYQIIENHQGTIDVQSEVNLGTTFTITLPKTRVGLVES